MLDPRARMAVCSVFGTNEEGEDATREVGEARVISTEAYLAKVRA
jgi:hypothetical protein